jgi:hypothetical protein
MFEEQEPLENRRCSGRKAVPIPHFVFFDIA